MKQFFGKHSRLLTAVATLMLGISASAGTFCIAFVWHDEPQAPAFMMEEWQNN